jgi:hypothetical protein
MMAEDILTPFVERSGITVYKGDCIETMRRLPEASVDAIITDPPYGLEFMGRDWDGFGTPLGFQTWTEAWAREAYRVLKPGGHLLAFAGTRTYHRMASGVEDAGFEVRDCIAWMYGSGFPKSKNLDGAWQGWGTALKPAFEPIVVARKPLAGTVAQNVLEHGTGALNIDATRIGWATEQERRDVNARTGPNSRHREQVGGGSTGAMSKLGERHTDDVTHAAGRWPANVALDDEAAKLLDQQSGETSYNPSGIFGTQRGDQPSDTAAAFAVRKDGDGVFGYGDRGGASRFFYCAKASKRDRNTNGAANTHPTVKPTELMRWLIRLVTPPGGIILDPFGGSGSTGVAAQADSVRCILIEREDEYLQIIRDRLDDGSLFSELA